MPKQIDETGKIYGKLTVSRKATKEERTAAGLQSYGVCWICKCECGNERIVPGTRLRHDNVIACENCSERKAQEAKSTPYIPKEDLTGKIFGHWEVIGYAKEKSESTRNPYWICQCDCDNHTVQTVRADGLKSGRSHWCSLCSRKNAKTSLIDLTGQKFERLTVLKKDSQKTADGRVKWICQCNCENHTIISVAGESLRYGNTRSCGCLQKEAAIRVGQSKFKDLTGQKFGHLTAIKFEGKEGHHSVWLCQCDCQNKTLTRVYSDNLKNGHTQTCGLCKKGHSLGEEKVATILKANNIPFFNEQPIKINDVTYRFDFFVDNKYFVEYDGIGHFKATGGVWNTEENVKKTQERDNLKNEWCKNNNIPIIRIPYTHFDELCIEDLLLATSPFLLKWSE